MESVILRALARAIKRELDSMGAVVYKALDTVFPQSVTNAPRLSVINSRRALVGAAEAGAVTIVGGEYQIGTGDWTSDAGTVAEGDVIRVRATSSGLYNTAVTVTLTVNSEDYVFTVTTLLGIKYLQSARDQHLPPAATTGSPTVDVTLVEGSTVFVLAGYYRTTDPQPQIAITDTLDNTYTEVLGARCKHTTGVHLLWFVCQVETGGETTITNTHNGSYASVAMIEFEGIGDHSADDAASIVAEGTDDTSLTLPELYSNASKAIVLLGAHHDSSANTAPYTIPEGFVDIFGVDDLKEDRPIFYKIFDSLVEAEEFTVACTGGRMWNLNGIVFSAATATDYTCYLLDGEGGFVLDGASNRIEVECE